MSDRIGFPSVHMATSSATRGNNHPAPRLPIARLSQLTLLPASNNPQMPVAPPSYYGYSGPSDFRPPQAYPAPLSYEASQRIEIKSLGEKFQALFECRPPVFLETEIIHPDIGSENLEKHITFYFDKMKLQDELVVFLEDAGVEYTSRIVGREIPVFNVIKDMSTREMRNMGGVHKICHCADEKGERYQFIERPRALRDHPKSLLISESSYSKYEEDATLREITTVWGKIDLAISERSLDESLSLYKPELEKIYKIIENRSIQTTTTQL
ncbi:MAG: hypothetical protein PW844_07980 [Pantoea sp.]|uniref:hypothetical protein n=1 Tax=Pantoea sp. TaxID=69393 RepID=UPI002391B754|nr:hypothetical protein [Pantoea sp.]MDE1186401.1 hypothetical protein [Pantoea sp.]